MCFPTESSHSEDKTCEGQEDEAGGQQAVTHPVLTTRVFFFFPVPVIFSVWSPCVPLEDWCVYKRKFHPVMRVSACVHCVCIVFTFRTHFDCRCASKEQKKKGSDFLSFVRKPTVSFHQYYMSQVCPLTNNKPLAKSIFQLCK